MTATLEQGLRDYAAGRYFTAHEHFEALWRAETDPRRRLGRQGIVLIAVAMHKVTQGNLRVAARLLRRARERLCAAPEELDGIAVLELRAALEEGAAALERGERISAPPLSRRTR